MISLDQNLLQALVQSLSKSNLSDFISTFLQEVLSIEPIKKTEILLYRANNALDTLAVGEKRYDRKTNIELKDINHFFHKSIVQYTRKKARDISFFPFFYIPLYNNDNILGFLTIYCNRYIACNKDFAFNFKLVQNLISLRIQLEWDRIEKSKTEDEYKYLCNQNQNLHNQITALSKELYSITSIATYVTPAMDLKKFIHKTLMKLNGIFKSNVIVLFLNDETKGFFNRVDFFPHIESNRQDNIRHVLKNKFLSDVKHLQKPTIIKNPSPFWQRYYHHPDIDIYKTIICSPLQSDKLRSGVIFLLHEEDINYDQNNIRLLSGISNIVGLAIENKILYHHSQQKLYQEDFIIQSITKFHEQQNLKETLKSVGIKVTEFFGKETHSFLLSNSEIPLVCTSYRNIDGYAEIRPRAYRKIQSKNLQRVSKHIFELKDSILIPDLKDQSNTAIIYDYFRKKGMTSLLSVPIWDKNEHFGDLIVVTGDPKVTFTLSDMHMLQAMTDGASIAIHNTRDFTKTEHNAELLENMIQEKNIQLNKIYETQNVRIDNRKDMIFWINSDKEFVFVNRTMESITGYSRKELYALNMKADSFLSFKNQHLLKNTFEAINNGCQSMVSDLEI